MIEAMEELSDVVTELIERSVGRPLSDAERGHVAGLIARLDEVRTILAAILTISPAEAMRSAMAGHARGQAVSRRH